MALETTPLSTNVQFVVGRRNKTKAVEMEDQEVLLGVVVDVVVLVAEKQIRSTTRRLQQILSKFACRFLLA
jgi:hypothetical protein